MSNLDLESLSMAQIRIIYEILSILAVKVIYV